MQEKHVCCSIQLRSELAFCCSKQHISVPIEWPVIVNNKMVSIQKLKKNKETLIVIM
jgi:hypothetical protein